MGQIKNIKLQIVTDIKSCQNKMVFTEPYPAQEALGTTKVGDLFGFLQRNGRPSSLIMRYNNWYHRIQSRYGALSNRPAARWPVVCLLGYMVLAQNRHAHDEEY